MSSAAAASDGPEIAALPARTDPESQAVASDPGTALEQRDRTDVVAGADVAAGADVPAGADVAAGLSAVAKPSAEIHTQATYRLLQMRGLAPDEAANLTAFLVGLEVHNTPWTIQQINRMLFLRQLYCVEGWGERERRRG